MATLSPESKLSAVALPSTGSHDEVVNLPFGVYEYNSFSLAKQVNADGPLKSESFVSGAVDQVAYTYAKLGGNVLDIEIMPSNVYTAYEEAVLEYSYMINAHQSKNVLMSVLGYTTGTFDQDGTIVTGTDISLKFPSHGHESSNRIASTYSSEGNVGGDKTLHSASIELSHTVQDYDLDAHINMEGYGERKAIIKQVYYKTPASMWRFFGFYGNFSMVGNMNSYGQYADDSIFYIVPVWQNKAQAISYEDALHTRVSQYSYEVINNKLRLHPVPNIASPKKIWVRYMVPRDPWAREEGGKDIYMDGINNVNTIPLGNIPFENINSVGKQWIRRYALALCKEMLAQIRGKIQSIPIPNGSVTLNAAELLNQSREEKTALKQELQTLLDQMVYTEVAKQEAEAAEAAMTTLRNVPAGILVG